MPEQSRTIHSKLFLIFLTAFLFTVLATYGCDGGSPAPTPGGCNGGAIPPTPPQPTPQPPAPPANGDDGTCQVTSIPSAERQRLGLSNFYQKYASAGGIPVVTSLNPDDEAVKRACQLVTEMTSERPDVRQALINSKVHFSVIAVSEQITDIPEYAYLPDYYNYRARGLGGDPAVCAEENILCLDGDRWRGENICVHEYAHTIATLGLYTVDPTFERRLVELYNAARAAGTYRNTYAMQMPQEYWAEGVQDWYDTNLESIPANGVHNHIDTREELLSYDPGLYNLINELLPEDTQWYNCYEK